MSPARPGGADNPSERAADLVALADLVRGWWLGGLRAAGGDWRGVNRELAAAMTKFCFRWPPERIRDRTALRLRLFKEHGI